MCDNSSGIHLSKNYVHHSRSKHIYIKHHFIQDLVLNGDIEISFLSTNFQLDDIFTKPLLEERFFFLRKSLNNIENTLLCLNYFLHQLFALLSIVLLPLIFCCL